MWGWGGPRSDIPEGIWPPYASLGYRNVVGVNGKEPDPEVAPFVVQLHEKYGIGRYSLSEGTKLARKAGMAYRNSGDSVLKSLVHKILRNRIYIGDIDWDRKTYRGTQTPLISRDLWARVQAILNGRASGSQRVKYEFAASGIIRCGHWGCPLVGEMKKTVMLESRTA